MVRGQNGHELSLLIRSRQGRTLGKDREGVVSTSKITSVGFDDLLDPFGDVDVALVLGHSCRSSYVYISDVISSHL